MDVNEAIRQVTGINLNNFDSDLNAMHEAESTLKCIQCWDYCYELGSVLGSRNRNDWSYWEFTHANARQRAEAFLRTLKLWKE